MKKTQLALLAAVLMGVFIFQGCKKYEDGPHISLKSKTKRLLGNWTSEKVLIDNTEWQDAGSIFYNFKEDGSYQRVFESGEWEFDKDKEKLLINTNFGDGYEITILRLTSKELWLERVILDKLYEYHFEKNDE